jgi:hypothetical protein
LRIPAADGSAYELMTPLRNTDSTMFFSFAVEDSCWWITAVLQGQDRSEEAGMRPREFTMFLDEVLSKKFSKSDPHTASGRLKADYASGPANQQAERELRARESKKEQNHANQT